MEQHPIKIDMDPEEIIQLLKARGISLIPHPTAPGWLTVAGFGRGRITQSENYVVQRRAFDLNAYLKGEYPVNYGPCCGAGCTESVFDGVHIIYLPYLTTKEGTGWGCDTKPPHAGALAVLCRSCGNAPEGQSVIRYAISGHIPTHERVLVRELYDWDGSPVQHRSSSSSS